MAENSYRTFSKSPDFYKDIFSITLYDNHNFVRTSLSHGMFGSQKAGKRSPFQVNFVKNGCKIISKMLNFGWIFPMDSGKPVDVGSQMAKFCYSRAGFDIVLNLSCQAGSYNFGLRMVKF